MSGSMRARDAAGSRPLITVITVVFNNRDGFAGTAASVCEQKDASFEWVVIDGGSTDGTVDLIKAHAEHMAFWVSERDSGIYDAMNKGLANAKGEFCVFMNSGDRFAGSDTLHKVAEAIEESPPGIGMLLGAALFELSPSYRYVQKPRPMTPYVMHSVPTSHQAMYFRTELHKQALFDPGIRIAADYDAICRMYKLNPLAGYTDEVIAHVWRGLESNSIRHPLANIKDMARTQRRVFGLSYPQIAASAFKRALPVVAFRLMSNPMTAGVTGRLISFLRPSQAQPSATTGSEPGRP
jgi:putative colanic acid biosynthesis glycosyltransferase